MRKVTKETVIAFLNKTSKKVGNTVVTVVDGETALSLHGNIIALNKDGVIQINNKGYETNTTKERLNGLLEMLDEPKIYQSNFSWYRDIDGVKTEFPYNEWVTI